MKVSHPTVRKRVDDLPNRLGRLGTRPLDRLEVLRRPRAREIAVEEAESLPRG